MRYCCATSMHRPCPIWLVICFLQLQQVLSANSAPGVRAVAVRHRTRCKPHRQVFGDPTTPVRRSKVKAVGPGAGGRSFPGSQTPQAGFKATTPSTTAAMPVQRVEQRRGPRSQVDRLRGEFDGALPITAACYQHPREVVVRRRILRRERDRLQVGAFGLRVALCGLVHVAEPQLHPYLAKRLVRSSCIAIRNVCTKSLARPGMRRYSSPISSSGAIVLSASSRAGKKCVAAGTTSLFHSEYLPHDSCTFRDIGLTRSARRRYCSTWAALPRFCSTPAKPSYAGA